MEAMTKDDFTANRESINTAWVKSGDSAKTREENEQYNVYLCAHLLNLIAYQLNEVITEIRAGKNKTSSDWVPCNS